jgi:hypothetical protein
LTLALEHLNKLGVPSTFEGDYSRNDAVRLLQGHSIDPVKADLIHAKLAAIVGVQLTDLLEARVSRSGLGWRDRLVVRTLPYGESSASFLSFEDGSHAILVSRALQEGLIRMANALVYFDVATSLARLSFRRKTKERKNLDAATRVTALLRYLLLGHRMRGKTPRALAVLDRKSFQYAGEIAVSAVRFVVAHELAHIAHNHVSSSVEPYGSGQKVSVSEIQELQADDWAMRCVADLLDHDSDHRQGAPPKGMALWAAFLGLIATQITEQSIYIRRNRSHPEAWARWAVLEKQDESDERTSALRLAFMAASIGATKLDEQLPPELWGILWKNQELTVEESITPQTLQRWDFLQTCPIEELLVEARRQATPQGLAFLEEVNVGELPLALSRVGISDRRLARMLDPSSALEFSTLRSAIADVAASLVEGDQQLYVVAAVRVAAEYLRKEESR